MGVLREAIGSKAIVEGLVSEEIRIRIPIATICINISVVYVKRDNILVSCEPLNLA